MTTDELIGMHFQSILGSEYLFKSNHAFQTDHYKPLKTPYGTQYDVDFQTFKENADKIIAVVQSPNLTLTNTDYDFVAATYLVQFWVPINIVEPTKHDDAGNAISLPRINFTADMDRLKYALKNKWANTPDALRKMFFTVSEPKLTTSAIERSGAFDRACFTLQGQVNIKDKNLASGSDLGIELLIDGSWWAVKDPLNIGISVSSSAGTRERAEHVKTESREAAISQEITFYLDNYNDETDRVMMLFEDRVLGFTEIISPHESDERLKRMIKTRLYNRGGLWSEFWGILNITLSASGNSGTQRFQVSITNSAIGG